MPYERCIETWARVEGTGLIPGPGRRSAGQVQADPDKAGHDSRSGRYYRILCQKLSFFYTFLRLFSKLMLLCWDNGRSKVRLFRTSYCIAETMGGAKVMIFHAFYKNRDSILRGVRLGCNLY